MFCDYHRKHVPGILMNGKIFERMFWRWQLGLNIFCENFYVLKSLRTFCTENKQVFECHMVDRGDAFYQRPPSKGQPTQSARLYYE